MTEAQKKLADKAIKLVIEKTQIEENFDLTPYFYPKQNPIFEIPDYAIIARGSFTQKPAVYVHETARNYYLDLAREYFIQ